MLSQRHSKHVTFCRTLSVLFINSFKKKKLNTNDALNKARACPHSPEGDLKKQQYMDSDSGSGGVGGAVVVVVVVVELGLRWQCRYMLAPVSAHFACALLSSQVIMYTAVFLSKCPTI
ncbi:hypothetical protein Dimus_034472 [Dionaea muscipula]